MAWRERANRLLIEEKEGPGDLVSQADRDTERAIRMVLAEHRPQDGVLDEEDGATAGRADVRWIVDPIDGTTDYLYGRPDWAVSVAAAEVAGGRLLAGVVIEPALDLLTQARAGERTQANGTDVGLLGKGDLARALVELNVGRGPQRAWAGRMVDALVPRVRNVRRGGSAAAALAQVATGRADALWAPGLQSWDCAAGALLVLQAGGTSAISSPPLQGHGPAAVTFWQPRSPCGHSYAHYSPTYIPHSPWSACGIVRGGQSTRAPPRTDRSGEWTCGPAPDPSCSRLGTVRGVRGPRPGRYLWPLRGTRCVTRASPQRRRCDVGRLKWAALSLAALTAGVSAIRRARSPQINGHQSDERWLTVTINRPVADVQLGGGALPAPLDRFGDKLEARICPAPGDRGTELAVRLKEPPPALTTSAPARLAGQDPRQEIRTALREAKALLEAGEVMQPDTPPTTHDTPGGKLIGLLSRRSGGEGVL
ncbi:inositol monophosphatase family protein [Streptomyces flavidovirens]|uniref:inositol monophosphatase family protein n=1 Tax=Streptomyces flavidovirens TaxID=67298 RepID=UPI0034297646